MEQPPQRLAVAADAPAISALMRASIRAHFPRFYDARHTESAARYIGELDMALIEDGTYYVHEADGEIVACGGGSTRVSSPVAPSRAKPSIPVLTPPAQRGQRRLEPSGRRSE